MRARRQARSAEWRGGVKGQRVGPVVQSQRIARQAGAGNAHQWMGKIRR